MNAAYTAGGIVPTSPTGGAGMTSGLSRVLGPLLQLFGTNPDEQTQNLKALMDEIKGTAQQTKAVSQYSPELFQRFSQLMQPQQPQGYAPPIDFTPAMAQAMLRGIR